MGVAADSQERRRRGREIIDKMLAERTQMLVLFCKVTGTEPFRRSPDQGVDVEQLQDFCSILVDYIAGGHFSLYQRIVERKERRQPVVSLAEDIYPRIAETTQMVVDFSEKYESLDQDLLQRSLQEDLSQLGEELATRIELEDQLITALIGEPVEIESPDLSQS